MENIQLQKANCNAGPATDKANFAKWVEELSNAFHPEGLFLSAAVSASQYAIDDAYDIPKLGQHLDFINLMSYDYHAAWEDKTGHHSPLYKYSQDNQAHLNTV